MGYSAEFGYMLWAIEQNFWLNAMGHVAESLTRAQNDLTSFKNLLNPFIGIMREKLNMYKLHTSQCLKSLLAKKSYSELWETVQNEIRI
jgi:hypothetical protein